MRPDNLLFPLSPKNGALVSQDYRRLFEEGCFGVPYSKDLVEPLIQPASLDTLTEGRCFCLRSDFRHEPGLPVIESVRLSQSKMPKEYEIPKEGFFSHLNFTWIIPLKFDFFLPEGFS